MDIAIVTACSICRTIRKVVDDSETIWRQFGKGCKAICKLQDSSEAAKRFARQFRRCRTIRKLQGDLQKNSEAVEKLQSYSEAFGKDFQK
jgi:hypothetical protein